MNNNTLVKNANKLRVENSKTFGSHLLVLVWKSGHLQNQEYIVTVCLHTYLERSRNKQWISTTPLVNWSGKCSAKVDVMTIFGEGRLFFVFSRPFFQ